MKKGKLLAFFFKTDALMPPDRCYYEKHSAEILELYLSLLRSYATFCSMRTIKPLHIDMDNFDWPPHKKRCGVIIYVGPCSRPSPYSRPQPYSRP